jgi:SAM-dependent methyltransferase
MLEEADEVLEDWFAGGAEQATLVRLLAGVGAGSNVIEIGCGLGRLATALRRVLTTGEYIGVDVVPEKISFLQRELQSRLPSFRFFHINAASAMYNPDGTYDVASLVLPCASRWADAVVAMAVFTHLLPEMLNRYLAEASRVLRSGGRLMASVYLLDYYDPLRPRPERYSRQEFSFEYPVRGASWMRTSDPDLPEAMLAVDLASLKRLAATHGLALSAAPHIGSWSGFSDSWTTGQDLVIFTAESECGA